MHISRIETLVGSTDSRGYAIEDCRAEDEMCNPDRGNMAIGVAAGIMLGLGLGVCTLPTEALAAGPIFMGILGGVTGQHANRLIAFYEHVKSLVHRAPAQSWSTR